MGTKKAQLGFTLIELIIVVGITSVISGAIVFSGAFSKPEKLIEQSQDDLISHLYYLQGKALTGVLPQTQDDVEPVEYLTLDIANSRVAAFLENEGALEEERHFVSSYELLNNTEVLGEGLQVLFKMETGDVCYNDPSLTEMQCDGVFDLTLMRGDYVATIEIDTNGNSFNQK
jgi:prepilin-type N-terminal cleavage/methylation domain-containing protein